LTACDDPAPAPPAGTGGQSSSSASSNGPSPHSGPTVSFQFLDSSGSPIAFLNGDSLEIKDDSRTSSGKIEWPEQHTVRVSDLGRDSNYTLAANLRGETVELRFRPAQLRENPHRIQTALDLSYPQVAVRVTDATGTPTPMGEVKGFNLAVVQPQRFGTVSVGSAPGREDDSTLLVSSLEFGRLYSMTFERAPTLYHVLFDTEIRPEGEPAIPIPGGPGQITGRIVDQDGSPVQGVVVWALRFGTLPGLGRSKCYAYGARTDSKGLYRIRGLPTGRYALSLAPIDGFEPAKWSGFSVWPRFSPRPPMEGFRITGDESVTNCDWVVEKGITDVELVLSDGSGPAGNRPLEIHRIDTLHEPECPATRGSGGWPPRPSGSQILVTMLTTVLTETNGTAMVRLPSGSFYVVVARSESPRPVVRVQVPDRQPSFSARINISAARDLGTIQAEVQGVRVHQGKWVDVQGVTLCAVPLSETDSCTCRGAAPWAKLAGTVHSMSEDGVLSLRGLMPGTYRVTAIPRLHMARLPRLGPDSQAADDEFLRLSSESEFAPKTVELEKGETRTAVLAPKPR
jgi:hypothetical protein